MKNRYNKILIFLLALAMAFGLLQTFESTAQATDVTTVTTLEALKNAITSGGAIKLTADITTSEMLDIKKTVSLDLNGYGILRTGNGRVIKISSDVTLELSDSNPTTTHYITLDKETGRGTAVSTTATDGAVEVKGGYITGGYQSAGTNDFGGCIRNQGTLIMNGGTITGNHVGSGWSGYGGGVYNDASSTFIMNGGAISGNNTVKGYDGGGVYNEGTFTMNDGTISGNNAENTNNGGGVKNWRGTFIMNGGTISGNNAAYGGGVFSDGDGGIATFIMNGGTISGNNANEGGGVRNGGTFTMSGGTISGNNALSSGGVYNGNTFTMSGGTISGNNVYLNSSNPEDSTNEGGGVFYFGGTFNISGSPTITGNFKNATKNDDGTFSGGSANNVFLWEKRKGGGPEEFEGGGGGESSLTFTIDGNMTDDAKIGVTMKLPGVFTSGLSGKGSAENFTSDSYSYRVALSDAGEAQLVEHVHSLSYKLSGDSCLVVTCSEAKCPLPNSKATLTISAPVTGDGKAVLTSDPEGFFENLPSIKYQSKEGGKWGAETTTPPTAEGIHRASLTYQAGEQSFTLSVSYGMNCIVYQNTDGAHGKVLGPGGKEKTGATVGATVEPEITPDTGYEVETLTVTPDDAGVKVTVNGNKSFIMPDSTVKVSATFKLTNYSITIPSITGGTVTVPAATAHYQDTITLTITPATGYEFDALSVVRADNNQSVTVTDNKSFVMPPANVKVNATFKAVDYTVEYSSATHGTVSGAATAKYQATVTPVITPETGYELDTLSVVRVDNNQSVTVTDNKSFVMPPANVKVNATFKVADYNISSGITNGSISIAPTTAHYGDTIRIVVSPNEGYGLYSINVPDVELRLISRDTDTGVEVYGLTMPAKNITVNVDLRETTIYTIFYKAASGTTSVFYRFYEGDAKGFRMRPDAKVNDVTCWAGQMNGVIGKTSFPLWFKSNSGRWGNSVECPVKTNFNDFAAIPEGSAVLVAGDDKAFIAAFNWGAYDTDAKGELILRSDLGNKYYFVSNNTTSISVPNPTKTGYDLAGWTFLDQNYLFQTIAAGSGSTTVKIKGSIDQTTTFSAVWKRKTLAVTYDLNGGSWSNTDMASIAYVTYGGTTQKPADPIKTNYAFDHWEVKMEAQALKGNTEIRLTAGSEFDFASTKIIENVRLKAVWKHTHSYAYIPLSMLNTIIPNSISQEYVDKYGSKYHLRRCVNKGDDEYFELHEFDKDGVCLCGTKKPEAAAVDATCRITYNNRDNPGGFTMIEKVGSEIVLEAPTMGTDKFVKWEYRSLSSNEWSDLTTYPVVGFLLPGNIQVNAVYKRLTAPELTLKAERYKEDGLLFTMNYVLPTGWTAKNAAIVLGDNYSLGYRRIERHLIPPEPKKEEWSFSGFLKAGVELLGQYNNMIDTVFDYGMDMLGIKDPQMRNMLSLGKTLLGGSNDLVDEVVDKVIDTGLKLTGLDDTVVGDMVNLGKAVYAGDEDAILDGIEAGMSLASKLSDNNANTTNTDGEGRYELWYVGREDNLLRASRQSKSLLIQRILDGKAINVPGSNNAKYTKAQNVGTLTGLAYTGYTGLLEEDAFEGNRYLYSIGWVEYTEANSNVTKMAVVGPIGITYNEATSAVTNNEITLFNFSN